ncbi:MAG: methyltransferase domain-containing protein [Clostridiales bacterium]|nr:methyltransferase domain-containing protein [Clostridiales bacterium]
MKYINMRDDREKRRQIRESYDLAAADYAREFFNELDGKPFDRSILDRFSKLTAGKGKVCDIGCGPGEVACYLKKCGLDVTGVDISSEMIAQAKKLTPEIEFLQGDMFKLPFEARSLAGIAAFYSIVNYRPESVGEAFSEFYRVIAAGGYLLIAFHTGKNKVFEVKRFFNKKTRLRFCYFDTDDILGKLVKAGFKIDEALVRYPYKDEHPTKRAYIIARK